MVGVAPELQVSGQDEAREAVRAVAAAAAAAAPALAVAPDAQVAEALAAAARLLRAAEAEVLAVAAEDAARAEAGGMSAGLLDRLRLDPARVAAAADALDALAGLPTPPATWPVRTLPTGEVVLERRVPVGVIGATYEARPAVTLDVAGQVLRARSAAVLRTGSAALPTSALLVDRVLAPALAEAGLPPGAVGLVRLPGHAAAEQLVAQPDLAPLVVVRGSGDTTRRLAALGAAAGVRVLAHADGGGVLYADAAADEARLLALVDAGLDRLGVCNRPNLLLVHRDRWDALVPRVVERLAARGVAASLPPHDHALGHEWALDGGREATVTLAPVAGPDEAAATAVAETSGLAATVVTEDAGAAARFLAAYTGTGAFWNATTRLLDGQKLLGLPETGISVDRLPGPRGPVTAEDLSLRQYVVLPPGTTAAAVGLG